MIILHKVAKNRALLLTIIVGIFLCAISNILYNHNYEQTCKKINLSDEELFVECKVSSFPEKEINRVSFCARIENCSEKEPIGKGVFVSVKDFKGKVHKGDKAKFKAKLLTADSATNEGAFDYKNYLKSLDVVCVCYPDKESVEITKNESLLRSIYDIRLEFIAACEKYIHRSGAGLVSAMLTGDRSGIDAQTGDNLKTAGIYHIVAISGLHLNLFIMAICDIIAKSKLGRRKKALWSFFSCVTIGLFVMVFTGFGISVIRAYIMMLILFSASLVPREANSKNSLFVTGFIVTILMPYTLYSVSWWLSFLSTLGVIDGARFADKIKTKFKISPLFFKIIGQTFIISFFTTVYTLPVTSYVFGYLPVYSWIANALVLPVMGVFIATGVVFAFSSAFLPVWASAGLGYVLTAMGEYISFVAKAVSAIPFATIDTYHNTFRRIFCFGICSFGTVVMMRKKQYVKMAAFVTAFTVAVGIFLVYNNHNSEMTITFADAGQGDCTLVEINGYNIMIDCGTQDRSESTISSLEAMIRAKNIRKLDAIFVTHYHTDHTNGAISLLEKGKSELLVLPKYYDFEEGEARENKENLLAAAAKSNTKIRYVEKGAKISLGNDANLEIISPNDEMFFENNDMSLIARVKYGKTKALFLGDAEDRALEHLMNEDIECDILKLAHHGGYCDMSEKIIKKAKPKACVASCGENNMYGHPDKRVLSALEEVGCDVYRTDHHGAVAVKADKKAKLTITTKR